MLNRLIEFITKHQLFEPKQKVLLAVSGGMDSVFMCHLFAQAEIRFGIAHCNFGLRAEESNGDAQFVEELAKKLRVPFHLKSCETKSYAKAHDLSIQMAARELRFAWFEELSAQENYIVYATAHHIDDAIETYFINQLRGTGIAGLHGLKPKNGKLIHPLLFVNRKEIESYLKMHQISYREDSSNKSIKYLRNSLRHQLLPILEEINPSYRNLFMGNMQRFGATESIFNEMVELQKSNVCKEQNKNRSISIPLLFNLAESSTYLYEFVKDLGFSFSQAEQILSAAKNRNTGAQFFSSTHQLIVNREELIISKGYGKNNLEVIIDVESGFIESPIQLNWQVSEVLRVEKDLNIALLDYDQLEFPLILRTWKEGDYFHPLGLKGKKLLSDFFIDLKLSRYEKESTWLLFSGDQVAWVIGFRIDDRFKITNTTKKVLRLQL
ncbi:MAG: tRNA lysidine(34) synthetase TilS, partial [Bacteroidales bacterium]|nr:tRNA lysidine(34) synthetase TilS [Bacteroidales bacterium]